MNKLKLIRNLKPGYQFFVSDPDSKRTSIVTVSQVQETIRGIGTGKRIWIVMGDYPWWFPCRVTGYHNDKIEIIRKQSNE